MPTATATSTVTAARTATPSLTVFDSRSAFTFVAGALLTDDYEAPGYAEFQSDASMNAVKGLTRYRTTFFPDFDEVIAGFNQHIYAGGFTSGSFELDFTAPSLGGSGVHVVGFDYINNIPVPYVAFVSFSDGSSQNFTLHASAFAPPPLPDFFGLISSVEITRIHIGLADGEATADNLFALDNLSIAAPAFAPGTPSPTGTSTAPGTATPTVTRTATTTKTATAISTHTQPAVPSPTSIRTATATAPSTATPTVTPPPTSTPSATRPPIDAAPLAASARLATEPIFQLFDFQARVGTPGGVAGRSGVSGCQQFDCFVFGAFSGTEEDCCSGTQFSQFFSSCMFDDDLGRIVSLDGLVVLDSDSADVCTGTIPVGASFTASLGNFTHDVLSPDGSFSRTFQELSERFEVAPGGCTVSEPDQFGFGIRGDGRRFINGELQQFQSDGFGTVLVDLQSDVHALEIAVGSTREADGCTVTATLNGSVTSADFRAGTQFSTALADFHVVQSPQADASSLELNGTVRTDCLGDVTLSTIEPLRVAPGDTCFSAGRLTTQLEGETVSVTYTASGAVELDIGADGNVDQHFAACTEVPIDQCRTSVVGLCGACTALNDCQTGLGCFPCSAGCSGQTMRCSLPDAFATCEDGIF